MTFGLFDPLCFRTGFSHIWFCFCFMGFLCFLIIFVFLRVRFGPASTLLLRYSVSVVEFCVCCHSQPQSAHSSAALSVHTGHLRTSAAALHQSSASLCFGSLPVKAWTILAEDFYLGILSELLRMKRKRKGEKSSLSRCYVSTDGRFLWSLAHKHPVSGWRWQMIQKHETLRSWSTNMKYQLEMLNSYTSPLFL